MTLQHLKYIKIIAETGSITEAAKRLFVSQPSLSSAIKEIEKEVKFAIFSRSRTGIALTKEGMEFLGYARQVLQQMDLLEDKFIINLPKKQRFCVSTQHYTFTANAFVEMVKQFGQERFEFILNETQTHQILEDVKNRFSDLGIIYISNSNEIVIRKALADNKLTFFELFSVRPHIFLRAEHPLAHQISVKLDDLKEYPRLNFIQGMYESAYFSEELYSMVPTEKSIKVSDRAAIVNLMIGLDGYTISSGIFPRYLHGDKIIAVPLDEDERMCIGYVLNENQELSGLGQIYVAALKKYNEKQT